MMVDIILAIALFMFSALRFYEHSYLLAFIFAAGGVLAAMKANGEDEKEDEQKDEKD